MADSPSTRGAERANVPRIPIARAGSLLGRIFKLARPEWRSLALGVFFLVIGSVAGLAFPQAIRVLIDGALANRDQALLDRATLALVAVFMLQGFAMGLRYVLLTNVGERVVTRLRVELYRRLLSQEIAFFDGRRTGELTNRLASDTTVLQTTVSANVSMLLRNLGSTLGGVSLLLYTSPVLTLLMLSVVPPVALGAVWFGRKVRGLSRDVQDSLAVGSAMAEETLSGIRTVRVFAAEGAEGDRYAAAVEKSFLLARARSIIAGTFMGGAAFAAFFAAALVLWWGSRMVLAGGMTAGSLVSFLIYTLMVAFSLGALGDLWADFMRAAGAAERVFELVDRVPQIAPTGGATLAKVEGRVELRGVVFAYPTRADVPVLQGLDLVIAPGEAVAVVGPSGAGKSTIASLLTRLYDPQGGQLLLDGTDLRALEPSWLRGQIGVVSQEPILFSSTIAENIRYGRAGASEAEVEAAARAANAHEFVSRFPDGYRTLVGERGVQLSGGQKQRIAIARAVLKDPRLLILDEATSALDAESEHLVQEALERLLQGRTTLIIAHRLSTVLDADRVVVLDGGRIAQQGTHTALMSEGGLYRRLVERQFVAA